MAENERLCVRALGIAENEPQDLRFEILALLRNLASIHELMGEDSLATWIRARMEAMLGEQ